MSPPADPRALTGSWTRLATALALLTALSGCAHWLHTPYERPAVATPGGWAQGVSIAGEAPSTVGDRWWEAFGDANLNRLIEEALVANADLAAATSRVRQAQLRAELVAGSLRPTPTAGFDAGFSRSAFGSNRSSGFQASLGYEVDLWGRLSRARDAAQWQAEAAAEDRAGTALALQGTLAQLHWQLGALNERLASAAESLDYAERTRTLVRAQYRAGAVSSLETRQADAAVAGQDASRQVLLQKRIEIRYAMDLLFDAPPGVVADAIVGARSSELVRLPAALPPQPDAGLPASLLARRPDLMAAEHRLRGTLTEGDAIRASYYPALTLTAGFGTSSADLTRVLANPVSTLGVGLLMPFLRINDMRIEGALAQERYAEAAIGFRQALYRAFGEVENALSARRHLLDQGVALDEQLAATRAVETLYEIRYRAGAAGLQLWLDAQERRRVAQIAVTQNRLDRLTAQVTLYQVLGGDSRR